MQRGLAAADSRDAVVVDDPARDGGDAAVVVRDRSTAALQEGPDLPDVSAAQPPSRNAKAAPIHTVRCISIASPLIRL